MHSHKIHIVHPSEALCAMKFLPIPIITVKMTNLKYYNNNTKKIIIKNRKREIKLIIMSVPDRTYNNNVPVYMNIN